MTPARRISLVSDQRTGAKAPALVSSGRPAPAQREYYVILFFLGFEYECHRFFMPQATQKGGYRAGVSWEYFLDREDKRLQESFGKAETLRWWACGGRYNLERSTELRDLPASVQVFHHQTIWEMYEAIGYDVKAKQFVGKEVMDARKEAGMRVNRPNVIYRDGILMGQQRERTSNVPLRYKNTWRVRRIKIITESEIDQYDRHCVTHDDDGKRVVYTAVEQLGVGLTKRQALALLG